MVPEIMDETGFIMGDEFVGMLLLVKTCNWSNLRQNFKEPQRISADYYKQVQTF